MIAICPTCARSFTGRNWQDGTGYSIPAHKCPHKHRCPGRDGTGRGIACLACAAVLDVRPEVLAPPCIWCAPIGEPEGAKGNGCARCRWVGTLPPDTALMAELRATTAPIVAPRGRAGRPLM